MLKMEIPNITPYIFVRTKTCISVLKIICHKCMRRHFADNTCSVLINPYLSKVKDNCNIDFNNLKK